MEFKELLLKAQKDDKEATEELFFMYRPLLIHRSMFNGQFSEDLYQELSLVFLNCIKKFRVEKMD